MALWGCGKDHERWGMKVFGKIIKCWADPEDHDYRGLRSWQGAEGAGRVISGAARSPVGKSFLDSGSALLFSLWPST